MKKPNGIHQHSFASISYSWNLDQHLIILIELMQFFFILLIMFLLSSTYKQLQSANEPSPWFVFHAIAKCEQWKSTFCITNHAKKILQILFSLFSVQYFLWGERMSGLQTYALLKHHCHYLGHISLLFFRNNFKIPLKVSKNFI